MPSRLTWNNVLAELAPAQPAPLTNAHLVARLGAAAHRVAALTCIMCDAGTVVHSRAPGGSKTFCYPTAVK